MTSWRTRPHISFSPCFLLVANDYTLVSRGEKVLNDTHCYLVELGFLNLSQQLAELLTGPLLDRVATVDPM